jgi:hypothetical protein
MRDVVDSVVENVDRRHAAGLPHVTRALDLLISSPAAKVFYHSDLPEQVPYEPWFDDYAVAYDLVPGDMPHWALNEPHRVANYGVLNVSPTIPEPPDRPGGGAGPPAGRRARVHRHHHPATV